MPRRRKVHRIIYGNYGIYYRIVHEVKAVEILRIRHAARDERRMRLKEEATPYSLSTVLQVKA